MNILECTNNGGKRGRVNTFAIGIIGIRDVVRALVGEMRVVLCCRGITKAVKHSKIIRGIAGLCKVRLDCHTYLFCVSMIIVSGTMLIRYHCAEFRENRNPNGHRMSALLVATFVPPRMEFAIHVHDTWLTWGMENQAFNFQARTSLASLRPIERWVMIRGVN